ncbi:cellulose biosynthesis protein BcsQ [Paraburkholderia ginsengisoli]|uniref:Cellulose synthase operon protein YhjQ n=1 Tax=Paraburkholderia ginsengisoli TaxID=311231 RepID=A0A7T4N4E7_9BURK|nr:cellulose biosynthesis protein BcsQ [Paraburkholderia ginsengisoli]QQC65049.1 cellulose synthase operon protein YhjQ [Paraburkholderia ginsengisoli]
MKTVAVVSTAGGTGRTTLSAALAVLLARRGRQVVALDFDPQNLLGAHLGIDGLAPAGLAQALLDETCAWHAHTWRNAEGVLFVPYGAVSLAQGARCDARLAAEPRWLATALAQLDLPRDGVVLIDTARYPSQQADQAVRCADLVLCVTPPEPAACATLVARLDEWRRTGANLRIIVNRLNPARDMQRDVLAMLAAALGDGLPLAQRVHLDVALPESFARGTWLFDDAPHSQASHDLHGLANWLDAWVAGNSATAARIDGDLA